MLISVIIQITLHWLLAAMSYYDPNRHYSLPMTIFWDINIIVDAIITYGTLWLGLVLWYLVSTYIKMKFNEISHNLNQSLKHKNLPLILRALDEHNFMQKMTSDMNVLIKYIIMVLYFCATPAFEVGLFAVHRSDTSRIGLFATTLLSSACFCAVLHMNLMSTWVTKAAHKPYQSLYRYTFDLSLPLPLRLKLVTLIENLSGPDIGFYCYDLFPMNNHEFYEYVYIAGANYFLIMDLF